MNELIKLQSDLSSIASELKAVQHRVAILAENHGSDASADATILKYAKRYYRSRRAREKIFGSGNLFADPAWDILIDLFISAKEGKEVSVSSLCIAAAVPATTGLRWIKLLESEGMIERTADPVDARRFNLSLSEATNNELEEFFQNNFL